jgi:4-amino-4-deoxy-L-arabinose transferase-like glycosyltransferase
MLAGRPRNGSESTDCCRPQVCRDGAATICRGRQHVLSYRQIVPVLDSDELMRAMNAVVNLDNVWQSSKSRSRLAAIGLLVLLALAALALRLYRLDGQSLWYDEGFSVFLARMDPGEIVARTAADIQPPLYYLLLHGWMQFFGDSEWAVRSLSVLWAVLAVPLIYALALELFHSRLAGMLAALLLVVSPLHLWYGQEARMYSLLTFLCLLSGTLLLLAMRAKGWAWAALLWLAYTLVNVAAVYTHYFAFFVLAFQAAYLFLVAWSGHFRHWRLLAGGLAAGLATVLAYLPWLPHLLARYGADASYLPGRLKIGEVLVDVAVAFAGGESVLEGTGLWLAAGYGLVLALCLVALLAAAARTAQEGATTANWRLSPEYHPLLFLLLYLLLPVALILAVSFTSPKFNARYAMISHPALLLLLAGGLAVLWQRGASSLANVARGAAALLALFFLLTAAVYADYNAYSDPAFARADFRGAARFLQQHAAADEAIILSSGHMFPVWDYYAAGGKRYLLPDSPTLDTTRTLDYSIAEDLNRWLAGQGGVWLVLWQNDVVDPNGYLTSMLGDLALEEPVGRTFPKLELRHYRLPAGVTFSGEPAIKHPARFNFGDRLELLGYSQTGDRQVTLFWKALQPLEDDYRVSVTLRDTQGQAWGTWDGRPGAYYHPTERWRVGQVVFGRYDLKLLPGAPPGDYGLEVGVYTEENLAGLDVLDAAGAAQGKRAMLGAVALAVAAARPDEVEVPHPQPSALGDGLGLLGWDLDRTQAQPGDKLLLTLFWLVEAQPRADDTVWVLITDAAGRARGAGPFLPTNAWHPTSIWLPGQAWRGQIPFRLPVETEPGAARLAVQLIGPDGSPAGPPAELTTLHVSATNRVFVAPEPQARRRANFEDLVALIGADLAPSPVAPGGVIRVLLYWQALAEMDVQYSVFVHLLDVEGQVIAGHDGEPAFGARPTTGWVPGEYVADAHDLLVPAGLAPGEYIVEVGMYDAGVPGMPRLSILGDEGQAQVDRVIFGPVPVR